MSNVKHRINNFLTETFQFVLFVTDKDDNLTKRLQGFNVRSTALAYLDQLREDNPERGYVILRRIAEYTPPPIIRPPVGTLWVEGEV